jgi:hypothetical protein
MGLRIEAAALKEQTSSCRSSAPKEKNKSKFEQLWKSCLLDIIDLRGQKKKK